MRVMALVMDNVTRWEGKYKSLKRFLKLRLFVQFLETNNHLKDLWEKDSPLSEAFWNRLGSYLPLLENLHVFSKYIQGKSYPTRSSVPHFLWKATSLFDEVSESTATFIEFGIDRKDPIRVTEESRELARVLKSALDTKFANVLGKPSIALKAAVLDPAYCKEVKGKLSEELWDKVWDGVWKKLYFSIKMME